MTLPSPPPTKVEGPARKEEEKVSRACCGGGMRVGGGGGRVGKNGERRSSLFQAGLLLFGNNTDERLGRSIGGTRLRVHPPIDRSMRPSSSR